MNSHRVSTLKAYAGQLDRSFRNNSQTLNKQIALKNQLITRRAQKETKRSTAS